MCSFLSFSPEAVECRMHAWILAGIGIAFSQQTNLDPETAKLRATVANAARLPHEAEDLALHPPLSVTMVSSVAVDGNGLVYILQRGEESDPVLVADAEGRIVRTWGRGLYTIPHNIRIDPEGNVWTVDAGSSEVYQFTPDGKTLRRIAIELPENPRQGFRGTTDIAFATER
jgi:hypothetical protein